MYARFLKCLGLRAALIFLVEAYSNNHRMDERIRSLHDIRARSLPVIGDVLIVQLDHAILRQGSEPH